MSDALGVFADQALVNQELLVVANSKNVSILVERDVQEHIAIECESTG
jgi:hypothetical protein